MLVPRVPQCHIYVIRLSGILALKYYSNYHFEFPAVTFYSEDRTLFGEGHVAQRYTLRRHACIPTVTMMSDKTIESEFRIRVQRI